MPPSKKGSFVLITLCTTKMIIFVPNSFGHTSAHVRLHALAASLLKDTTDASIAS